MHPLLLIPSFPSSLPLFTLIVNRSDLPSNIQAGSLIAQHNSPAEDTRIAHIRLADVKTWNRHCPLLYVSCAAFADRPEVWTDKDI